MDVRTGAEYAEQVCRQLEGKPMRNLHGLLANAWTAGAVFGLMHRPEPKRKRRAAGANEPADSGATDTPVSASTDLT